MTVWTAVAPNLTFLTHLACCHSYLNYIKEHIATLLQKVNFSTAYQRGNSHTREERQRIQT